MAIRIIAQAGVRLHADGRALGLEMRAIITKALREAFDGNDTNLPSPTRRMAEDADRDSNSVRRSLARIMDVAGGLGRGFASAVGNGMRLALIGTAAVGALAGVTQLALGVGALVGAMGQAAGVAGLLPAVLAGFVAVSTTVKLGVDGMSESFKALGSGDMAAFEESLKDLAPSAREFARAVRDIKPGFDQMKLDIQQRLFEGLGDRLRTISGNYLPLLNGLFTDIAGSINSAGHNLADFVNQGDTVGQVGNLFGNIKQAVSDLVPSMVPLTQAFLTITEVGSRFLPRLASGFTDMAGRFSDFIDRAAASGQLEQFFNNAIEALKTLGRIAGNVFGGLKNVMEAARQSGSGLLTNIENLTQRFQDWTGSFEGQQALTGFFESMRRVVEALGPPFFSLITVIGRDFLPILADIASIIGPVLKPLFEALGGLLRALRPVFQALAEALGLVMEAFGPFLDALAEAISGAMPQLRPMIVDIGKALANLVTAMIPLAPLFVELLQTILPILPPFIQMIADIMPSLIELLKALMPIVQALADLFIAIMPIIADVANIILTVLIPVIQFIATVVSTVVNIVTGLIQGIWNVITTVFTAIADFIGNIWSSVGDFFNGIWEAIKGVFSGSLSAIWEGIKSTFGDIGNKILGVMGNILSGVGDAIGGVVDWFLGLPGQIWEAVKGAARWLYETGKNIIMGLINGIKDMFKKIISAITDTVSGAINAAKEGLGIASPSKVFAEIGRNVGLGLADGIASMEGVVTDAASSLADAAIVPTPPTAPTVALDMATAPAGQQSGGSASAPGGFVQNNYMLPGTDVNQFSRTVLQRGFGDFLSGANTLTVNRNNVQAGVNDQWVSA